MSKRRVAITGMGVLSPVGMNLPEALDGLRNARSGIGLVSPELLGGKAFAVGLIPQRLEDRFTRLELPFLDRVQQLAVLAAAQAVEDSGLDAGFEAYGARAGCYYANINGGAETIEWWYRQMLQQGRTVARPFTAMAIMGNGGAAQVSIRHRIGGSVISNASACASSGVAIGEAARAIADGYLDVALAGGAEAPLTAGVISTFDGIRALSAPDPEDPARTCKPFSTDRTGLVLGEGSAWVVLEAEEAALARGARIHGYLSGYGISADAYHIGMPHSAGQVRALRQALDHAGLAPADIGYINAHATATVGGDVIESEALCEVFGTGADAPPVSSTKSVHGHLIGATSALELILTTLAMGDRLLPASAHLGSPDPKCEVNHVGEVPVAGVAYHHALSFSCGFGGTNAALIVSHPDSRTPLHPT